MSDSDEHSSSGNDSEDAEDVKEEKPKSIFFVPKSFRKVTETPNTSEFEGLTEDDVEVWHITAPASFDPQCFHHKKIAVDGDSVIYAESNKTANVEVEYHLISQVDDEQSDCLFNVFPKSDGAEFSFSFGKPFAKRLKVIEKIKSKSDPIENAKTARKKLTPAPPNKQPQGLQVRFHPAGSDGSVLPPVIRKISKQNSHSLILKQRNDFLKAQSHLETIKQRKKEERRQRKAKREAKRAKKLKAAEKEDDD